MVWKIIKDTIKLAFYGYSLFALSFFAAMLCSAVQYHPLWNSVSNSLNCSIAILLTGFVVAIIRHYPSAQPQYRHRTA